MDGTKKSDCTCKRKILILSITKKISPICYDKGAFNRLSGNGVF